MRRQKNPTLAPMPSAVQRLFDTCKEVFADVRSGAVPSPADVERLRSVLDALKPQDVGLNRNLPLFKHASTSACLAKVNTDAIFKAPCETSVLYPATGGNMHCFTAVTACAVLDVLGPPYNDNEGRACTYYKEHAYLSFPGAAVPGAGNSDYAWLEALASEPEELVVRGGQYTGPEIVD